MTHENSTPQAANPDDSQSRISARRRLIKGSFAAPAALTLCNGSALAATSTKCVVNMEHVAPNPLQTTADTPTSFWRVQVFQSNIKTNGVSNKWVKGSDIVTKQGTKSPPFTPFLTNSEYYRTSPAPNVKSTNTSTTGINPVGTLTPCSPAAWVGLRVDINGNIVGIQGLATGTTYAMTATCWTSFRA